MNNCFSKFDFRVTVIALALLLIAGLSQAESITKKSKSGICHPPSSSHYDRTKNFTPYETLDRCISSGGRLAKGTTITQKAVKDASKYSRSKFGHGWADKDRDCQNTRQEVLIFVSTTPVRFADDKQCRVTFGRWISMYSGEVIFDASQVDIDHVVPLKWAWDHGADKWSEAKRVKFANDPINLLAVEASLNRQKGAKGLDEWLPPKNQVQYKARFNRILKLYGLKDDE